MHATNRQKKLLRFFGVSFSQNLSAGAAGWEIAELMEPEENQEIWRKYLYVTGDFDSESDQLLPYDIAALRTVDVPEEWSASKAVGEFRSELVAAEVSDASPFDNPQPTVEFHGRNFMFTGKFGFGSRKACQVAVVERAGAAPSRKTVSREIDFLVIGCEGSKFWKRGSYGNKIETAILARREHGSPAIISEEHWLKCLGDG